MSYDISIEGTEDVDINYTYNVGPMIKEACGDGPNQWSGSLCGELVEKITSGVFKIMIEREKYEAMNSPNGWGDRLGCIEFLIKVRDACEKYPDKIFECH